MGIGILEPEAALWSADYWLRRCVGFLVDTADGHLGIVEQIVKGEGEPAVLRVRPRPGGQLVAVPVAAVRALDPESERLMVVLPLRAVDP